MIEDVRHRMAAWLEQAWLSRYLDHGLDEEETAWFEAYLLDKPHLVAALEADERLRTVVLADPEALLEGRASSASPVEAQADSSVRRKGGVWLAWAAAFALGVGLGWFGWQWRDTDAARIVSAPPRIIYDTMRGALSAPREEPGDPASPIRLYEMPLPPGARIEEAHAQVDGRRIALPSAPVSADGYVTFALPAAWRQSGTLHLQLRIDEDGQAVSLEFTL